jgi:lysozyme family protein
MRRLIIVMLVVLLAFPAYAADCEKALFGWTTADGTRIQGILANEGVSKRNPRGYQNNPRDRGNFRNGVNCGGTAYGLACAQFPGVDMRTVTKARAVQIYHDDQWTFLRGDEFKGQYLAYKVFDLEINMGAATAVKLLQRTVNDLNGSRYGLTPKVPVNGRVTTELVHWINSYTAPQILADGTTSNERRYRFFEHLKAVALVRYGSLIAHNKNLSEFWGTWSDRAVYDR